MEKNKGSNGKIAKYAIDLSTFGTEHAGGKDEVAFSLIRGLCENGHAGDIICLCRSELNPTIRSIYADIDIINTDDTLFYIRNIKNIVRENNIKVILFTNKSTPWVRLPVPSAVIPHDIEPFLSGIVKGVHYRFFGIRSKVKILLDFCFRDRVVAISDYDLETMRGILPCFKEKYIRIYDPVRFVEINKDVGSYITALNIQWRHKNVETLIEAYARIYKEVPYNLLLIGKKPDNYNYLIRIIEESGIKDRVTFTGFVSDEDLKGLVSKTAIYVNPSRFEGFGMTAVEMMGSCIPAIISDTTAGPEVTMGLCRYYGPPDDPDELAKQILEEYRRPLSEERLESIANEVKERYSYIKISRLYWDLLESMAVERG
ncbi:MAG: glycosyltransferase family 4 protein [Lachnospiraceae bacterium]|nr:glycosyltransferase family 4 protein [Lachnospiraceae bacterium]